MKKVMFISLFATMLFSVSVAHDVPSNKIEGIEVSKIEKSYVANAEQTGASFEIAAFYADGLIQDDVYYLETTATDNYRLPVFEAVYIEPASPVPLQTA